MAGLTLEHVKKIYPGPVGAVEDFSLAVEDREFVVLVGPSGCGKSTVLRMIAGLEEITSGEIAIGGKPVNRVSSRDRDIAMVFQNYALYPHMSVYDNMAFSLRMHRTPRAEIRRRVEETARQLEITELLGRRPKALSGGQCQRVALGRAMVRRPAVFLLDEPLSNLDAKLRATMRAEISQLHRRLGGTFIYVTHDQTEAMTMGTRIVVMKDGIIQQADTPKQVYERPRNLFVAGFMGSPQMNFLPVTLRHRRAGCAACVGEIRVPLPDGAASGPLLAGYEGRELTAGIRPEHLRIARADEEGALTARVVLAELLGAETLLHLELDGTRLVARTPPMEAAPGSEVRLCVDAEKLHLFDPGSGEAVRA